MPHRKLLNKAFNYESLKSFASVFNKYANKLVSEVDANQTKNGANCETVGALLHASCLENTFEVVLGINSDDALDKTEYQQIYECLKR